MAVQPSLSPLVAPPSFSPVPDHLAETKIFTQIGRNSLVQAEPATIHFAGFRKNETCTRILRIKNVSSECQRVHLIPPTTKEFSTVYKSKGSLVPGLSFDVAVGFHGSEHRFYEDNIRIHCQGDENLLIPIYAYPTMDFSQFPRKVTFPSTPVGTTRRKNFVLSSPIPVEFEFEISAVKRHPAVSVSPMTGIIPANGSTRITVAFSPTTFSTAISILQLDVSQFNVTPLRCTVTGSSAPGLKKELTVRRESKLQQEFLDPRSVTPLGRVRQKRASRAATTTTQVQVKRSKGVVVSGVRFPERLDNHAAVAHVLNQKPGKLKAAELKSVVTLSGSESTSELNSRQMKEAVFDQLVRKTVEYEKMNQLKWMTRLGEDSMTAEDREKILEERTEANKIYQIKLRQPLPSIDANREKTILFKDRTRRKAKETPTHRPSFDSSYLNDPWQRRQRALDQFVQAARKVIVRGRAQKRLSYLADFMEEWKKGNFAFKTRLELAIEEEREIDRKHVASLFDVTRVVPFAFPEYRDPHVVDELAPESHKLVEIAPYSQVKASQCVTLYSTTNPIEYLLCGYGEDSLLDLSVDYTNPFLEKELREESLDELFHLKLNEDKDDRESKDTYDEIPFTDYVPDMSLTEKSLAPPLHIFSPMPGVQRFLQPLPYSEVDDDYVLSPQNWYPLRTVREEAACQTRAKLDKQDVISGFMHWKLFPSSSLVAANTQPYFSSVWLPRLSDPFNDDLLPAETPKPHGNLPEDDAPNPGEDFQDGFRRLTFENMKDDYFIPKQPEDVLPPPSEGFADEKMPSVTGSFSSHGFIPREFRREQMAGFLRGRDNRLGVRLKHRMASLEASLINVDTNKIRTSGQ
ncbi:cilia- and flagella-associated protein 221-like [Oscarella lobularis]|uniref:cilia- and flagella-associated protein 221-like n=1 Tax=Oscarella lobularis TaxID=121494 RepID=UPI003313BF92